MKLYQTIDLAIQDAKKQLDMYGWVIPSTYWQSTKSPDDTLELLNHSFKVMMLPEVLLKEYVKPNLPWADLHFEERVSGIAYNPPPSHNLWPFAQKGNDQFINGGKFDHTYPERFWPDARGIRFAYGDLDSVLRLLVKDPLTRQAFLPIWFPEDTGAESGQRVPCTLGYHFINRFSKLHIVYYIRSCDIVRHFRDDIYLALKLLYWVIEKVNNLHIALNRDLVLTPGTFTMHITSLHCFHNERGLLKLSKT